MGVYKVCAINISSIVCIRTGSLLEYEHVTPMKAHSPVKIEHLVMCLATMAYVYPACAIFSTGSNSDRFQILQSCTLLLQLPILMPSCCCVHRSRLEANCGMVPALFSNSRIQTWNYESEEWYLFSREPDVASCPGSSLSHFSAWGGVWVRG